MDHCANAMPSGPAAHVYAEVEYTAVQRAVATLDRAAEQRWLTAYAPLVKKVVRGLSSQVNGALDRDDMEQIALLGLLEALRRYGEPDDGFGSYAAMRVRGAVLDELRRQDWRPRGTRQAAHRLSAAKRKLRHKLGREPARAEVCAAMEITAQDYDQMELDQGAQEFASFDELLAERGDFGGMQQGPEAAAIDHASLAQALHVLDAREQRVIQLYYEFELSLAEIAAVLELTAARVCQINKAALGKMKAFLERG